MGEDNLISEEPNTVIVSGATGYGIDKLLSLITAEIQKCKKKYKLILPYSEQGKLSAMYNLYTVENVEYLDEGVSVEVVLDGKGKGLYDKYIVGDR